MEKPPLKAFGRSLIDFGKLNFAEQKLLEACRKGTMAIISEKRPVQANENNTVRADFVRFLALGGDEQAPVHEMGISFYGAWVEGELFMEGAILPHHLALSHCHLNDIILRNSKVDGFVSFNGCHINNLIADRMICSNSVFLKHGFTATGTVSLQSVQISYDLICDEGEFQGNAGKDYALLCDGAVIKGNVLMGSGFIATGTVRLHGIQIGGSLRCDNGKFDAKEGDALSCDSALITGSVTLNNGFTATGTVQLRGAQINGVLDCGNGKFDGKDGDALSCESALINGSVFLNNGLTASGTVRLRGSQINGVLDCANGKFDGKGNDALMCEDAKNQKYYFFNGMFQCCWYSSITECSDWR